ncbi:TetR/AcrR family transcriptional regulator [Mesorhizobium sp. CAU 1732]|uniref:TetR/AcrR family transcriptional regulator n=1 Tax=Mesorhizobium sp. CAU 1732 TaxID=3140358 RepID=UPI003260606D
MKKPASPRQTSDKFEKRRQIILDAAATLINRNGVRGLTFVEVAEAVGMNTTSITYYFRKKELLAAAAIEETIGIFDAMTREAEQEPDPVSRVSLLLRLRLDHSAAIRRGDRPTVAVLGDLRALEEPARERLIGWYSEITRRVAGYFGPLDDRQLFLRRMAAAQVLLDVIHWMRAWLPTYSLHDFDLVHASLMDLMTNGFSPAGVSWSPSVKLPAPVEEDSQTAYLRAATLLLNARGYRGASVDEIAAQLNLSKGSFYHHLDSKDDLVLKCFARSYERVSAAQAQAATSTGVWRDRLSQAVSDLLAIQFDARFPLLRTTAMQALPPEMRADAIADATRMANSFAVMLWRGVADGSLRPVNPGVASHCLLALVNSAYDFHQWAEAMPSTERAMEVYASTLAFGLFDDRQG